MAIIKLPIGPGPKKKVLRAIILMKGALHAGIRALESFENEVRKIKTTKKRAR